MTREDFLNRVHSALHRTEVTLEEAPALLEPLQSWDKTAVVQQFKQELEALGGHVYLVQTLAEAQTKLAEVIQILQAKSYIRTNDKIIDEVLSAIPIPFNEHFADADLGISGVHCALATTGTLVLTSEAGRIASLLPMNHIALVKSEQLVPTMAEALEHHLDTLPAAWVQATGPSRTADIELTLSIGVHGPGVVHVIVIDSP